MVLRQSGHHAVIADIHKNDRSAAMDIAMCTEAGKLLACTTVSPYYTMAQHRQTLGGAKSRAK
jgi:hypothetical protein